MPYFHTIDAQHHRSFLDENRHDPITGEAFSAGDQVVFCASCKAAFLTDSWDYLEGTHCGQSDTLATFPTHIPLQLKHQLGEVLYRMKVPYTQLALVAIAGFLLGPKIISLFLLSGLPLKTLLGMGLLGALGYSLYRNAVWPLRIYRGDLVLGITGIWEKRIRLPEIERLELHLGYEEAKNSRLWVRYKSDKPDKKIRLVNTPEDMASLFWALRVLAEQIPVQIHLKDDTYREMLGYIQQKTRRSEGFRVIEK